MDGHKGLNTAAIVLLALAVNASASSAIAGGFAIREQSTTSQGMSFAGAAVNDTLSAMYWNPAAVANQTGFNNEQHIAAVVPESEIAVTGGTVLLGANPGNTGNESGNIGKSAVAGAGYMNYQLADVDPRLFVGLSTNAPFGFTTEPENESYAGSIIGRTSKVFNLVATPTVGYKVTPWLTLGAGSQISYLDATFKFGSANQASTYFNGDDYGFGWTIGAMLEPAKGTQIGIGYRSQITYDLEGRLASNGTGLGIGSEAELVTPDILTVSLQQRITDRLRFMATYEWTDWSDFDQVDIVAQDSGVEVIPGLNSTSGEEYVSLDANWNDGWFVSAGLEYDYSKDLTLRGGVAYEKSPIREASQRLTAIPDNDRIWLSAGLSYNIGKSLSPIFGSSSASTIDFAYTHVFIEDGDIESSSVASPAITLEGEAEGEVDIVSFSLRTKF